MRIPAEYEWVKHGVPVWYRPSLSSDTKHAARVSGEPWAIGGSDATWVVHLNDVDSSYRNGHGSVKAAYLGALEPREEAERRMPPVWFERDGHLFWLHTLGNDGHPYPTQKETIDEDLCAAIFALPEERRDKLLRSIDPDHIEAINRGCDALVRKLDGILDTGEHHGTFSSPELEQLTQRLLALRAYPNLSWETLIGRFEKILDTGKPEGPFASVTCERLAERLLTLRTARWPASPSGLPESLQSLINTHLEDVVSLFECALDTGTNPGVLYGGDKTRRFVERLLELHNHPDPDFGCDPDDSRALCELRQAIDDHLVWPSEAQREGGDYLAAVEHCGKLARAAERLDGALGALALCKRAEDKP